MKLSRIGLTAVAVITWLSPSGASAWDPATTHAGLTQRAVLGSRLHQVLSERLGKAQGVFEPIRLHPDRLDEDRRRALMWDLSALDAEGGYRPDANGANTSIAWVTAGTVLAEMPARARHTFFDPSTGLGLHQDRNLAGLAFALREVPDSTGTVRQLAAGSIFDLTGRPATEWVRAADNELGLAAFQEHLEGAVAGADAPAREHSLARALMALGGVLAVLEDMGDPAHVRNDFRTAYLNDGGASPWDRSSAFEQYVIGRYGRAGVPATATPVVRPSFLSYFSAPDGGGLADRTQRLFFSDGTVPAEQVVAVDAAPADVLRAVRASLSYPSPTVTRLDLTRPDRLRHLVVGKRRVLAYQLVGGRLRFFLDRPVYDDAAREQLPLVGGYAAGLIDHLLGPAVQLTVRGRTLDVLAAGRTDSLPLKGRLRVFVDDAAGVRRELTGRDVSATPDASVPMASVEIPAGSRRVAAVLRGERDGEPVIAVAEAPVQAQKPAAPAAPAAAPSP